MGTPQSGITGHIRGWDLGGTVDLFYCRVIEGDVVRFDFTGGSNRGEVKNNIPIPHYCKDTKNNLVEYGPYKDKITKAKSMFNGQREQNPSFKKLYKKYEFWKWYEENLIHL
jgi:hypothetical protein